MTNKWIVIADRTQARIFSDSPFRKLKTLPNELGREKNRAMTTDKPGMSRSKLAQPSSTHALTGEKSPHEDAAVQFAREICRYLEHQAQDHRYSDLVIAAEPRMMGRIREFLPKNFGDKIEWLKKDFTHLSDHQVKLALGYPSGRASG